MKDMPMETPEELPIAAYSRREDPRDVLVLPAGGEKSWISPEAHRLFQPAPRILQLRELFPQATFASVRGNVTHPPFRSWTREQYGALVLAAAGLSAAGTGGQDFPVFHPRRRCFPAAGAGNPGGAGPGRGGLWLLWRAMTTGRPGRRRLARAGICPAP